MLRCTHSYLSDNWGVSFSKTSILCLLCLGYFSCVYSLAPCWNKRSSLIPSLTRDLTTYLPNLWSFAHKEIFFFKSWSFSFTLMCLYNQSNEGTTYKYHLWPGTKLAYFHISWHISITRIVTLDMNPKTTYAPFSGLWLLGLVFQTVVHL